MNRAINFLAGLLLGALVGYTVAILLAPTSGEEIQGRIRERADRIRSDITQAAAARRAELEQQLASLRSQRSS